MPGQGVVKELGSLKTVSEGRILSLMKEDTGRQGRSQALKGMEDTAVYQRELLWDFKTRNTTCLYFQKEKYCTSVEMNKRGSENKEKAIESKDNLGSRIEKNWLN